MHIRYFIFSSMISIMIKNQNEKENEAPTHEESCPDDEPMTLPVKQGILNTDTQNASTESQENQPEMEAMADDNGKT